MGNAQGMSFRYKGPPLAETERKGKHKIHGRVTESGPFFARGCFSILRRVTSAASGKAPHEAWHAFEPA